MGDARSTFGVRIGGSSIICPGAEPARIHIVELWSYWDSYIV